MHQTPVKNTSEPKKGVPRVAVVKPKGGNVGTIKKSSLGRKKRALLNDD
jgi:hypothetical protein